MPSGLSTPGFRCFLFVCLDLISQVKAIFEILANELLKKTLKLSAEQEFGKAITEDSRKTDKLFPAGCTYCEKCDFN